MCFYPLYGACLCLSIVSCLKDKNKETEAGNGSMLIEAKRSAGLNEDKQRFITWGGCVSVRNGSMD